MPPHGHISWLARVFGEDIAVLNSSPKAQGQGFRHPACLSWFDITHPIFDRQSRNGVWCLWVVLGALAILHFLPFFAWDNRVWRIIRILDRFLLCFFYKTYGYQPKMKRGGEILIPLRFLCELLLNSQIFWTVYRWESYIVIISIQRNSSLLCAFAFFYLHQLCWSW